MYEAIEEYICNHIDAAEPALARLDRDTHVYHLRPRMVSGHLQGRILKMICRMIQPRRVLELGTFTGYSALCFAEGMAEDGEVHTLEIDDEVEDFAQEHFAMSPYGHKVKMIIGDALTTIASLTETYDLVFIDANKRDYLRYYEAVLPLVRPGGFILADNTLWDGKVVTEPDSHDPQTVGINTFNNFVATDPRVEKVILPLRDGLTILWKKPE
ncbi:MAG: O-methyltransferase [Bacteroidaceae bacterium]|mgnify:CR=1 FL=1|nr:O-methyltransferase [Bacteroidales bacterium]MBP3671771.1 O-methyltransferase [Bacteroidaceae bacterium]MBQ2980440.1 O-methyltransferase [Bacteroidaceae bacterium]